MKSSRSTVAVAGAAGERILGRRPEWHRLSVAEAALLLGSDPQRGLDPATAARRLAAYGPNLLPTAAPAGVGAILLGQFTNPMVLILVGAAGLSLLLGEVADAAAIGAIVLLNAALGAYQELRAERSLAALRRLLAPTARVLRAGRVREVPAAEVVPGDVLVLESGDRVVADGRLVAAGALEVEEAALTGESVPVPKRTETLGEDEGRSLGDRANMVYQGTVVTRGRGRALVVATGRATEMGGIAGLLEAADEGPTPLQRQMAGLSRQLLLACLTLATLVAAAGLARGEPPFVMALTGISLAVAAIPEGLPAVVTIVLALGTQRLLARRALIRRLPAVETLGCATVICTDKTGTLTCNRMEVRAAYLGGRRLPWPPARQDGPAARRLGEAMVLCNDAAADAGDPTEQALVRGAAALGLDPEAVRARHPRVAEAPFDSERKAMSVACRTPEGAVTVFVKGAPERVLAACDRAAAGDGWRPLSPRQAREILAAAEEMAGDALRVLAFACRPLGPREADQVEARARQGGGAVPPALLEQRLVFLGLAGLMDPPRPEARPAVERCRQAGMRVVMVTGDHARTAAAVARELGLEGRVVTGEELDALEDAELAPLVAQGAVFARVAPGHKLRLVRLLRRRGEVVAMTGDGVNDAPALKEADIGVAMGRTGTEVTREAADMVLTDDNFATIVAAVEEGRAIYENIRKFVRYLLSCNAGEVMVMLGAALLSLPLPLLPIHLLLVNLVTDGLPAIALGVDPPEAGLMSRPPRSPREGILARGLAGRVLGRGLLIGAVTLAAFAAALVYTGSLERARTLGMAVLSLCQLLFAFECRSETRLLSPAQALGNRALAAAVLVSGLVLAAVIHVPALQALFHTVPLAGGEWAAAGGAAVACSLLAALAGGGRRL